MQPESSGSSRAAGAPFRCGAQPTGGIEQQTELLRRIVRRWIEDEADVEDVVQDTWVAALARSPGTLRAPAAWLCVVAMNLARRTHRNRSRRRRREEGRSGPRAPAASAPEPFDEGASRALASLREPYRSVLRLHYLEGRSVAEIAALRGVSSGTVKCQLHRGRGVFRRCFERRASGVPRGPPPLPG